jgi:hypothetical protein
MTFERFAYGYVTKSNGINVDNSPMLSLSSLLFIRRSRPFCHVRHGVATTRVGVAT